MTNKTFYATLAGGIFVVVAIAIAVGLISGAKTGTMADWVAATATVAAFGAAIIAARYAAGALKLESDREGQLIRAQRTAQAALVAAWPEKFIPNWEQTHDDVSKIGEGITGAVAMLRNASDVPVTNVHVDFAAVFAPADELAVADVRRLGSVDLAVLPPGLEPRPIEWSIAPTAVMMPGVPQLRNWDDYPENGIYDPSRLIVDITFRDAVGVLWHRDGGGQLVEVLDGSLSP